MSNQSNGGGMGVLGVLGIVFIVLKLLGVSQQQIVWLILDYERRTRKPAHDIDPKAVPEVVV